MILPFWATPSCPDLQNVNKLSTKATIRLALPSPLTSSISGADNTATDTDNTELELWNDWLPWFVVPSLWKSVSPDVRPVVSVVPAQGGLECLTPFRSLTFLFRFDPFPSWLRYTTPPIHHHSFSPAHRPVTRTPTVNLRSTTFTHTSATSPAR